MVKTKTVSVMVTLPEDLTNLIDSIIECTGFFSNRPDFIVSCMRYVFNEITDLRIDLDHSRYSCTRINKNVNILNDAEMDHELIRKYGRKEDVTSIMIRIPEGTVVHFGTMFLFMNRKDVAKYSIVHYIKTIIPSWDYTFSLFDGDLIKERNEISTNVKKNSNLSQSYFVDTQKDIMDEFDSFQKNRNKRTYPSKEKKE